jgi:hypothetical protein
MKVIQNNLIGSVLYLLYTAVFFNSIIATYTDDTVILVAHNHIEASLLL